MIKKQLKETQPIVYRILKNALQQDQIAHAYLFHGPKGSGKLEAAKLLAQSMVCEQKTEDGFACETCTVCQRIAHDQFVDLQIIDGSTQSIKKEALLALQKQFQKTSLEKSGKRIYIIQNIENATAEALNALLKFLEEPQSDIIAILLSEQVDRVLPTIRSRCQNVAFRPISWDYCFQTYQSYMNEYDAYMIAYLTTNLDKAKEIQESDEYQHAHYLFQKFQEAFVVSVYDALEVLLEEGFEGKKRDAKQCMQYFMEMLIRFYHSLLEEKEVIQDPWYQKMIQLYRDRQDPIDHILLVLLDIRSRITRSVHILLLCDQLVYKLKEVIVDE